MSRIDEYRAQLLQQLNNTSTVQECQAQLNAIYSEEKRTQTFDDDLVCSQAWIELNEICNTKPANPNYAQNFAPSGKLPPA